MSAGQQRQQERKDDRYQGYITVAERIDQFYARYPDGRIVTHIVEHDGERGFILMRAEVYRHPDDAMPAATGHAYEIKGEGYVNKTSHIENCETGCVGRALANCGFEVKRGIASREDMERAARRREAPPPLPESAPAATSRPSAPQSTDRADLINEGQMKQIRKTVADRGYNLDDLLVQQFGGRSLDQLSYQEGVDLIRMWSKSS